MRPLIFLAVPSILVACALSFPNPIVPTGLQPIPAADVRLWAAGTAPKQWTLRRFSFHYRDNDGSHNGRGFVQFDPPDSLYLNNRVSFQSGSAVVIGDGTSWSDPPDEIKNLAPSYELLWAMLGIARPPRADWVTESRQHGDSTMVRYTRGSDTVQYVSLHTRRPRLETYVVDGGHPLGLVMTEFDSVRQVVRSQLRVLNNPIQVDITFDPPKKEKAIDRDTWNAPRDHQ